MSEYDEKYIITCAAEKAKIREQFYEIEFMRDFLEWLFDKHVDWMTLSEAYEEFEKDNQENEEKT